MSLSLVPNEVPKIKVCRASGMPVKLEHIEKFNAEYKLLYDKVLDKFIVAKNKFIDAKLSARMNKLLSRLESRLHIKYPNTATWDMLVTPADWAAKITEVDAPIAVAKAQAGEELTYVILDVQF